MLRIGLSYSFITRKEVNMSEILVRKAIDRSKYPKTMMYVDRQGNICKADKPSHLSEEEKAIRKAAGTAKHQRYLAEKRKLREAMHKTKKKAKVEPTVENAEAYEGAREEYANFRKQKWREAI